MGLITPGVGEVRFIPHPLHQSTRSWPETNCYVDLWIEVLGSLGMVPEAALGSTVTQDFGIDQFTFLKIPLPDLELLYGLKVRELSIYHTLERHVASHVQQGDIVLLEADAFYLPDTAATTYRQGHAKTTIAIDAVDTVRRQCHYFHNATRGQLTDEDYVGVLRLWPVVHGSMLTPYVEVVGRSEQRRQFLDLRIKASQLLRRYIIHRPDQNPFVRWQMVFQQHAEELLATPALFHNYAFHFPRLAGSNFELLASHVDWLAPDELQDVTSACRRIAQTAKIMQFRLARSLSRKRLDLLHDCFVTLRDEYQGMMRRLVEYAEAVTGSDEI